MKAASLCAVALTALLSACGGGGGDNTTAVPPPGTGTEPAPTSTDVRITVSGPVSAVPAGGAAPMTLTVHNAGSAAATQVVVTANLGSGLELRSVVCSATGTASCPAQAALGERVVVSSLPAASTLVLQLDAVVAAGRSGAIASNLSVAASNDSSTTNNAAQIVVDSYTADVGVSASGPAAPVAAGASASYTLSVGNAGPDAARDVDLRAVLDEFHGAPSISCSATGGATCPASLSSTMRVPLLPRDGALTFVVTGTVAAGVSGSVAASITATAAGDPQTQNDRATALASAFVAAVEGQTSVTLESEYGDYIGASASHSYTRANARLGINATGGSLSVSIEGDQNWRGDFVLPSARTRFEPGTWTGLTRHPFHTAATGGLSWSGEGRGCNALTGSITVHSATYSGNQLSAIDLAFVQHCEGGAPALRGRIRWNASDATLPPGPTTAPAGLWAPAAGSTPATGSHVFLLSDAGDYIGAGRSHLYTAADARLSVTQVGGRINVGITGDQTWNGEFQAMSSITRPQVGYYGDLQRYPFHNPVKGGLNWSGDGRGCNRLGGWFTIDTIVFDNAGSLRLLELRFQQNCEGGAAALRGKLRWDASDTTAPAGPVNPPPTGLWSAPAGATPASGNYIYLASDSGDYVGAGRSSLYTQANAVLSVSLNGGGLNISVRGNEDWRGNFQAMSHITDLQPGYYGNLHRFPFHNPVKGGLSWGGDGRGCNTLTGWFVVDRVTRVNGTLAALDLRFEQHCEGASAALRGQIRWVAGDTTQPAGPVHPAPTTLWQTPPGAMPSGSAVYLSSGGPSDWLGQGGTATYSGGVTVSTSGGQLNVSVADWTGTFQTMMGVSTLQPGYYGELQRYPFHNITRGGMNWSGYGRGCNRLSGWFAIDSVTYRNGVLVAIDLRFEQYCDDATAPLRGRVRLAEPTNPLAATATPAARR